MELERVAHQVGRDVPLVREIALHLGELVEIEAQEGRIKRRGEMQGRVGIAAVIVVMRRLGADGELQRPAFLGLLRAGTGDGAAEGDSRRARHQDGAPRQTCVHSLPPRLFFASPREYAIRLYGRPRNGLNSTAGILGFPAGTPRRRSDSGYGTRSRSAGSRVRVFRRGAP